MSRWIAALLGLLLACAGPAAAHDTPVDTRVHAFVKTEGGRLHVLLRVPLGLLLNANLPKQGPGYLALGQIDEGLQRALVAIDDEIRWYEDGRRLVPATSKARISMPADKAFGSFDSARALIDGPPLPSTAYVFWNQGYLDAHLQYPVEAAQPSVGLEFRVAQALRDRVRLDLRYGLADGVERAFELAPANDRVALDPRWYQAALTFTAWGFEHILQGPDHLLFLLCLVLPFRRLDGYLVGVVSAFTVAHSITLIGAAYGLAPGAAWFGPLVETLIAASILFMAIENVLKPRLERRSLASAAFGLVHGFGFSFLLQHQLQFAGSNLLLSLLAFNVGVELGQLLALLVLLPLLALWRLRMPRAETAITIVVCALAGHVAWHWLTERATALHTALAQADATGSALLAGALLLLAGAALVVLRRGHRRGAPDTAPPQRAPSA